MKLRQLTLALSFILLAACGADDSSSTSPSVTSFDFAPYRTSNENVSATSLEGTWVASIHIKRERSDAINASVTPKIESNRLETFVIRPATDGIEMSYCGGGFDAITITGDEFSTENVQANIINFSSMEANKTATGRVSLSPVASYTETITLTAEYIKVSDQYESFGSINQNWSDTDVVIERDVYCSSIKNLEGGYRSIFIASDNDLIFKVSDTIDPTSYDAYIKDPDHDGLIANRLTLGEQSFSFSVYGPNEYIFDYSAESLSGLSVTGQVSISIPFTE